MRGLGTAMILGAVIALIVLGGFFIVKSNDIKKYLQRSRLQEAVGRRMGIT